MDMNIFRSIAKTSFRDEFRTEPEDNEAFNEMLKIFSNFFTAYRENKGMDHPAISKQQIRRLMRAILYNSSEYALTDAESYCDLIDVYFHKRYQRSCDHRINHFFSGQIIEILIYECARA